MEKIKKVIIDTDIGDDIDDAYAMLFAHKTNKIDILGVTTVNKNVHQRAKITKYLFNKFNRKIDVYEGIDDPIKEEIKTFVFDKKNENGEYQIFQYRDYMEKEKTEKNAIDFILNKASEFPNEITLLCIGPLTNIGLAYKKNGYVTTNS